MRSFRCARATDHGPRILEARSLQDAMEWAPRYAAAVGTAELDLRALAEKS